MKKYHPSTPSRRHMSTVPFKKLLSGDAPHKALTYGRKRDVGRNSQGRITMRHKGSGHKRLYRDVDFTFVDKLNVPARVETLEYDPNRSGFIARVCYKDGERRYILAPQGVKVGDEILTADSAPVRPGNRLLAKNIPVGTFVFNIEVKNRGGARLVRSAGNYAEVIAQDEPNTLIKLPSSEVRKIPSNAFVSVGEVSNPDFHLTNIGKAGRSRWLGIRPTVRGSAMNPVDHPYGGGEGRQGRGTRYPKTIWGKRVGGIKTRRPKKYSNRLIVSRRKTGKKKSQ